MRRLLLYAALVAALVAWAAACYAARLWLDDVARALLGPPP